MKLNKFLLLFFVLILSKIGWSQDSEIKLNAEKVQKFTPYLEFRFGGPVAFKKWKEENKILYTKEMWYYSESFYVKRNVGATGEVLDESIIDITRFENQRKQNEEVVIPMPTFKDAIVLLPKSKLLYNPYDTNWNKNK